MDHHGGGTTTLYLVWPCHVVVRISLQPPSLKGIQYVLHHFYSGIGTEYGNLVESSQANYLKIIEGSRCTVMG